MRYRVTFYKIKSENGDKPVKTVHSSQLLKCNKLPFDNGNLTLKNPHQRHHYL